MWLDGRWTEANDMRCASMPATSRINSQSLTVPIVVNIGIARGEYAPVLEQLRRDLPSGPATQLPLAAAAGAVRWATQVALDSGEHELARAWLDAHERWLGEFDMVLGRAEGALLWSRWRTRAATWRGPAASRTRGGAGAQSAAALDTARRAAPTGRA